MTSLYLTEEYTELTRRRLLRRVADEAVDRGAWWLVTWPADSDYWRLPFAERMDVLAIVYEESTDA